MKRLILIILASLLSLVFILFFLPNKTNKTNDSEVDESIFSEELVEAIRYTKQNLRIDYPSQEEFTSVLFYQNNGRDSLAITNGPLQYTPDYHFIGYCVIENNVFSFGWGYKNPDIIPSFNDIIDLNSLIKDESDYYRLVYNSNDLEYCGQISFCFFELSEGEIKRPSIIEAKETTKDQELYY